MPGRDRLKEIVADSAKILKKSADDLFSMSQSTRGHTIYEVENLRKQSKAAIDSAVDATNILIKEDA